MKIDYHLHTEYSYDSKLKALDLINKAIELKYDQIAITEHLDLYPYELSRFGLPSFSRYLRQVRSLQEQFASSPLRIICGVEIGDFQRVKAFADEFLAELEFELRLGAVHFLTDHTNVAVPLRRALSKADHEDYYRQNLALVSNCDIQVLAHLGVHKRYLTRQPDEQHCLGLLRDIFQAMIDRRIALEINFSALRKPYARVLPDLWQIELYRSLGGKLFSIGSDAHLLEHFDLNYDKLPAWLFTGEVEFPL
ncbi:MAG: histidinol-phosphatase HisJ family protein [Candidatus Cloacimonetes bacterium]|nr:histidinol-phosphatase HisJ family protein [Candidatus Cloacimonadota bacterium]